MKFSLMRTTHRLYIAKPQFWLSVYEGTCKLMWKLHFEQTRLPNDFLVLGKLAFNMVIKLTDPVFRVTYESYLILCFPSFQYNLGT